MPSEPCYLFRVLREILAQTKRNSIDGSRVYPSSTYRSLASRIRYGCQRRNRILDRVPLAKLWHTVVEESAKYCYRFRRSSFSCHRLGCGDLHYSRPSRRRDSRKAHKDTIIGSSLNLNPECIRSRGLYPKSLGLIYL